MITQFIKDVFNINKIKASHKKALDSLIQVQNTLIATQDQLKDARDALKAKAEEVSVVKHISSKETREFAEQLRQAQEKQQAYTLMEQELETMTRENLDFRNKLLNCCQDQIIKCAKDLVAKKEKSRVVFLWKDS